MLNTPALRKEYAQIRKSHLFSWTDLFLLSLILSTAVCMFVFGVRMFCLVLVNLK